MSAKPAERLIRRILVALDASAHSRAALEAAAKLAAPIRAELVGLFVEDEDLILTADLPFTHEVQRFPAALGSSSSPEMEQQLRAQARQVEQLLRTVARQAGIPWSFETARGNVKASVLAAAEKADLITVGILGYSTHQRVRIGSTTLAVLRKVSCPVMILQHGARLRPEVVVLYDASKAADRALRLAAQITQRALFPALTVLPLAGETQVEKETATRASEVLVPYNVHVLFRPLRHPSLLELAAVAQTNRAGLLIMPRSLLDDHQSRLELLLTWTSCPLILVK